MQSKCELEITHGEYMNQQEFVHCDDCPNPNGCVTRCGIQEYMNENKNVAEQRGETPKQLWGETE